ncbi:MAG: hypothetical protein AB7V50_00170 [Vampirovibrionia bacterium]
MIKLSKKLILFCLLILDLTKQLVVGVSIFLYNRTFGTRIGAFISIGIVALAFLFAMFVWAPSNMMASESEVDKVINSDSSVKKVKHVAVHQLKNVDKLLASNAVDGSGNKLDLLDFDAIHFQATEFGSGSVGRSEPFAPRNLGSAGMLGPSGNPLAGGDESGLSAEELAAQEAEKRRDEIRRTLGSDVTVKGIIFNESGKDPMAIVEYMAYNGELKVKTVVPGDVLPLSSCEVTVTGIEKNTIDLKSEDVEKRKYLPEFEDETEGDVVSEDTETDSGDNLMPPPVPSSNSNSAHGGKDSSMGDAKKKIEEIDKLLDSF